MVYVSLYPIASNCIQLHPYYPYEMQVYSYDIQL